MPIDYTTPITSAFDAPDGSQPAVIRTKEVHFDLIYIDFPHNINFNPIESSLIVRDSYQCTYRTGGGSPYRVWSMQRRANYVRTYDVYESNDENFTTETKIKNDVGKSQLNSILTDKRYLRIVEKMSIMLNTIATGSRDTSSSSGSSCPTTYSGSYTVVPTVFNMSDSNFTGGFAKLYIQIKDASNNWQILIPHTEFGTITYGQQVLKEIGESVSNHVLPSSQSLLRAVLEVTGGIETGVSIIKVA